MNDIKYELWLTENGVKNPNAGIGAHVEATLTNIIRKYFYDVESTNGTDIDKKEGTDCIADDVRIDFTSNFSSKNNMNNINHCGALSYGIRTGNSHGEFAHPVLVLGTDAPYWNDAFAFIESFDENLVSYLDTALDLYDTYCGEN